MNSLLMMRKIILKLTTEM